MSDTGLRTDDPHTLHGGSVNLEQMAKQLQAELAAPSDESLVTVAQVHMQLRRLPAGSADALRVQCLLDVAQFFYISGRTVLGLEPAQAAVQTARQLTNTALLRRALTVHGALLADSGNLPLAIESQADSLELALALGDTLAIGSAWNNLGLALLYGAQFREALKCFEQVVRIAPVQPALGALEPLALLNIAVTSLFIEDYAHGLQAVQAVLDTPDDMESANAVLNRVLAESTCARLLLEVDQLQAAQQHCERAKTLAAQSRSQRAELAAAIAEGLCEVRVGHTDAGLSRLQTCLEQARIMKSMMRDALIALVKAYEMSSKPQLALVHLRELLHYTKKTQQEKALFHHKMHLERLGVAEDTPAYGEPLAEPARLDRDRVRAQWALLQRQAIAAELIEEPSGEHCYRVGKLAGYLAAADGCDSDTSFMVEMSARLHDIGKLGIPDALLVKREPFDYQEKSLVQTHTNIGAELLGQSGLPRIDMAVDVARHHHEWFDGSGYPDGLAGGAIPRAAQYVALADAFDVLMHDRAYHDALSRGAALEEIRRGSGTQFDPRLVELFCALVERLAAEHQNLEAYLGAEARENPFIQARQKIAKALKHAGEYGPTLK